MNKLKILLFILIIPSLLYAKKVTISGYITDKLSGERLIGANVFEEKSLLGTTSNTYGFYSFSLDEGQKLIKVSFIGYQQQALSINLVKDTVMNIQLMLTEGILNEITVTGNRVSKVESSQMSMIEIPLQKLEKIPMIMGEADILKAIQLLPGVQSGTEGTSGIYVRGGGPDQNLFLLDGVPVYNANHLFGFFSVFNPDAVKSVDLYKGGFPARFGGRLSSVVDIRMKEGNEKEFKGDISVGLISSKFTIEGPIIKDKTSFIVSARRTYIDLLAQPFILMANKNNESKSTGGYYFYDLNAKINHKFSDKSRLFLSVYSGKDRVYGKDKSNYSYQSTTPSGTYYNVSTESKDNFGTGWGNIISALRWNYIISNRLFSNTTVTYSKYKFDITYDSYYKDLTANTSDKNYFNYFSGIEDLTAKVDFDYYPNPLHAIKFGVNYTNHDFRPGVTRFKSSNSSTPSQVSSIDTTFGNVSIIGHDFSAFVEDNWDITPKLKVNVGLHFSLFNVDNTTYPSLQPRVSMRFKATDDWSLKASYSKMTQYVHLLSTSGISLPTDLWLPVTSTFAPPVSNQVALGTAFNLPKDFNMTIEGFYKTMTNLIEYKEGASFGGNGSSWESKVEKGKGWAYGCEFMVEKNIGKTTGWIGYTLSWTERQFENLNFGRVFPAKYDRRHDISVVVTHEFSKRFDIGATWVYGTGNAVTLSPMLFNQLTGNHSSSNFYYYNNLTDYTSRNNYRMPAYHRLDVGLNFHKKRKHGIRTWNISAYNAYNRKNPFYLDWGTEQVGDGTPVLDSQGNYMYTDFKYKTVLKQFSLFPIIPSITYSYKF